MHDGSTRNSESGVDLVGQLFNMYVTCTSSLLDHWDYDGLTGECGDSRYCRNTSCREIGDGVAIEPASFHTHIRRGKREKNKILASQTRNGSRTLTGATRPLGKIKQKEQSVVIKMRKKGKKRKHKTFPKEES